MPTDAVLAEVVRSGFVEGAHRGHAVLLDASGGVDSAWGDPKAEVFPRSSNKPAQAEAMVRLGLALPPRQLALAAASHSGEAMHLAGVTEVLATVGLDQGALRTPEDYPLDAVERDAWLVTGRPRSSVAMNCSGKHAAMLVTCVVNGWSTGDYLDPGHPLQVALAQTVSELAGERIDHVGVDGCGAPLLSLSLVGLARSVRAIAMHGGPVAVAMRAHPELVGGTRRDVTVLMQRNPGLLAKDGAEGVYVLAWPDGRAAAVKVLDGAERARTVVVAALVEAMGGDPGDLGAVPVLGGGRPVGEVRAALR